MNLELLRILRRLMARVPEMPDGNPFDGPALKNLNEWADTHWEWFNTYLVPKAEAWTGGEDKGSSLQFLDHCIQMEERKHVSVPEL